MYFLHFNIAVFVKFLYEVVSTKINVKYCEIFVYDDIFLEKVKNSI